MTARIVQKGQGEARDFVIIYHLAAQLDASIKGAFGPGPCIVNVTLPPGKGGYSQVGVGHLRAAAQEAIDAAKDNAFTVAHTILIGFSEGVAGVRAQLKAGCVPDVAVVIDGTHSTLPVNPVDVALWKAVFTRARDGQGMFVGTHSGLVYVETLKAPDHPYACTHRVLEMATGWTLPLPRGQDVVRVEGNAVIVSNGDGWDINPKAHVRQATDVLPTVLRDYVVPYLMGADPIVQPEEPIPPTLPAPPALRDERTLGVRCVEWASQQVGKHGQPVGSHDSPDIRAWRAPCMRGTGDKAFRLNIGPTNWCAIFACAAVEAVIQDGETWPHGYRAGVVELVQDTSLTSVGGYTGRWTPVSLARSGEFVPAPGDLAIYDRSQPGKPETSWWRHVNRVVSFDSASQSYKTVGGNEAGDAVCLGIHKLSDAALLGFIAYPTGDAEPSHLAFTEAEKTEIMGHVAMFMQENLDDAAAEGWGKKPDDDAQV